MNHNQYLINYEKIVYAESWLIIGKKAHNLMGQHQINDFCTLINFEEYLQELCHLYKNPFEAENAHIYLCNIHKQDFMSFVNYYHLFSQKKEHS